MMKFKRSRASRRGRIEIIPMIDVMFFLLATFMLASLSMQRLDSIKLNLPQGTAEAAQSELPPTLSVDRTGHLFVNRQAVDLDKLASVLKSRLGPDATVMIAADENATHGAVINAMLEARKAGVAHFMIAVRRDD